MCRTPVTAARDYVFVNRHNMWLADVHRVDLGGAINLKCRMDKEVENAH